MTYNKQKSDTKQTIYIDNDSKWKATATVGIWIGVGIGSICGSFGDAIAGAGFLATLIIWVFG